MQITFCKLCYGETGMRNQASMEDRKQAQHLGHLASAESDKAEGLSLTCDWMLGKVDVHNLHRMHTLYSQQHSVACPVLVM